MYTSIDFRQSWKHWGERVSEQQHQGQFMLNKDWTGESWTASPLRLYSFIRSESEMWKQKLGLEPLFPCWNGGVWISVCVTRTNRLASLVFAVGSCTQSSADKRSIVNCFSSSYLHGVHVYGCTSENSGWVSGYNIKISLNCHFDVLKVWDKEN